jgi:predicted ribosome quality control (RQC) complex YloA/Tae2 family protein
MLRSSSAPARCLRRAYAAVRAPARRGHLRTQAIATRVSADADAPAAPPAPPARKKLPAFDYTALVASVAEIRALAVPTKVEVAVQADAYTLVLGLRGLEGKTALHVSWHPDAARVSLGPPPPRVHKTENLSFGEQAQAVLRNLILVEAVVPEPWERVAVFGFAARPGDAVAFRLHVETQGRNSNAVLTQVGARADRGKKTADPGGDDPTFADKIVACAYQVGSSQTSVRPLSPGFAYQPPPPAPGVAPDAFGDGACADRETFREAVTVAAATAPKKQSRAKKKNEAERTNSDTSDTFTDAASASVRDGLVRAWRGVSPALARSLLKDAGFDAGVAVGDLSDKDWDATHAEWTAWARTTSSVVSSLERLDETSDPASNSVTDESSAADRYLATARWREDEGQLLLHAAASDLKAEGASPLAAAAAAASTRADATAAEDLARSMPVPPVGALFASVYGEAKDTDVFRREKDRVTQGARAALKKTRQKVSAFRKQIADAADFEKTKTSADEIMAYLHGYVEGSNSIEVFDFETGESRSVAIDPLVGAKATAEKLYKQARKRQANGERRRAASLRRRRRGGVPGANRVFAIGALRRRRGRRAGAGGDCAGAGGREVDQARGQGRGGADPRGAGARREEGREREEELVGGGDFGEEQKQQEAFSARSGDEQRASVRRS